MRGTCGPAAQLKKAGGRWKSNIQRDMLRQVGTTVQSTSWFVSSSSAPAKEAAAPVLQKAGAPVILPRRLVEQLLQDRLFGDDAEAITTVADCWDHLAQQDQAGPWAKDSASRTARKRQDKLVAMGLAKNSMIAMCTYKADSNCLLICSFEVWPQD